MQLVQSDVELAWVRLRGQIRFAILAGDITEHGGRWDEWGVGGLTSSPLSQRGIDSDRRAEWWELVKALAQLRSNDPFGAELIRRDIGTHCDDVKCRRRGDGRGIIHWHKVSWTDLGQGKEALRARLEGAIAFVVEYCR